MLARLKTWYWRRKLKKAVFLWRNLEIILTRSGCSRQNRRRFLRACINSKGQRDYTVDELLKGLKQYEWF